MSHASSLRDVLNISVTNAVITLGGIVSGVVVARMLGPEARGDWAAILLLPSIFGFIGTFGVDVVLGRRVAINPDSAQYWATYAIYLALAVGTAVFILAFVISNYYFPGEKQNLVKYGSAIFLAVPAIILNTLLGSIALAARHVWLFNCGRLAITFSYLIIILFIWTLNGASLDGVVLAYVASVWFGSFVICLTLFQNYSIYSFPVYSEARDIVRAGIKFAPGYVVFAVSNNASTLWLTALADSKALGLYVVALTFASTQQIAAHALAKTAFAHVAKIHTYPIDKVSLEVAGHIRRSFLLLCCLAICLLTIAPWIIPWVFGTAFSTSAKLVLFLAPAVVLVALSQIMEEALKAVGFAVPSVMARLCSGVVASLFAVVLIPQLAAKGMAISYLLAGITESIVFVIYLKKHLGLSIAHLFVPQRQDWEYLVKRWHSLYS